MNMDFGANKTPVQYLRKEHLEELILEIFILVLIVNDTKNYGNNLRS